MFERIIRLFDRVTGSIMFVIHGLLSSRRGAIGVSSVIMLSIAFFVFAILGSMGLNYIAVAVNGSVNSTVKTVAVTICSILFAIGVAVRFLPGKK